MEKKLFNSKNLWIDSDTAYLLSISEFNDVYVNNYKVIVQTFFANGSEYTLPVFALRAKKLFALIKEHSEKIDEFKVFSNFKENTSRLFTEYTDNLEKFAEANWILEKQRDMNEQMRFEIFDLIHKSLSQDSSKSHRVKRLNKLLDTKNKLQEENKQIYKLLKEITIKYYMNGTNENKPTVVFNNPIQDFEELELEGISSGPVLELEQETTPLIDIEESLIEPENLSDLTESDENPTELLTTLEDEIILDSKNLDKEKSKFKEEGVIELDSLNDENFETVEEQIENLMSDLIVDSKKAKKKHKFKLKKDKKESKKQSKKNRKANLSIEEEIQTESIEDLEDKTTAEQNLESTTMAEQNLEEKVVAEQELEDTTAEFITQEELFTPNVDDTDLESIIELAEVINTEQVQELLKEYKHNLNKIEKINKSLESMNVSPRHKILSSSELEAEYKELERDYETLKFKFKQKITPYFGAYKFDAYIIAGLNKIVFRAIACAENAKIIKDEIIKKFCGLILRIKKILESFDTK